MMTYEEFLKLNESQQVGKLNEAMERAETSDTPYIGVINDEIHVNGDPNKTEIKRHDYEIIFAFPNTSEWRNQIEASGEKIEVETENFLKVRRQFRGIHLMPRRASRVIEAFARIMSFLRSITVESKDEVTGEPIMEIKPLNEQETIELLRELNTEVEDCIYEAVGRFIGLSPAEQDAMLLPSAIYNAVMIAINNPEIINEGDLFFGLS